MKKTTGFTTVLALALVAAIGLHACGNNGRDKRQRERCDACDPAEIDQPCVDQCRQLCAEGEDCTTRCTIECDRCKADLECRPCTTSCTGTVSRCAPVDTPLTCEDGQF